MKTQFSTLINMEQNIPIENVEQFFTEVDAAAVHHNASTRFTDGFEFGFGTDIGISTLKHHAPADAVGSFDID
ncbi:hypothetical protein GCM10009001_26360 [Virgibacillus siamensis]|uniref:Uncharacterized protein n=1 Tax=Virgibacillus siamensis TaxID=480071 RepID=A0ABN1GB72_9BACI